MTGDIMALPPERLYKAHVENLRAVEVGISQIDRELRAALSRKDDPASSALLKILLLLLGSWAECRLRKLLYEPGGFDNSQRDQVMGCRSQFESWICATELGFRRRYGIRRADLRSALPGTARLRLDEILDVLDTELRPIIEMRNTLAHGQWARPLNASQNGIVGTMLAAMNAENALSARFKSTIIATVATIVQDLVSGNAAFERDFDRHYERLKNARRNLLGRRLISAEPQAH